MRHAKRLCRTRRSTRLLKRQDGSIVLEAALVLPLFVSFVIAIIAFIQIAVTEMAVQSAVSETTKLIATGMYPVDLLYREAKTQWTQSKPYAAYSSVLDKITGFRSKVETAETFVDDYAAFIPDPVVSIVEWEKEKREHVETMAQDKAEEYVTSIYKPLLNQAFTAVVSASVNKTVLDPARLRVVEVTLPNLESKDEAVISIEAEYELNLLIPFYHKTVHIRKKAYERAWVGAA
ncbi:TadE/TadG family type IV pilus assembly protein [Paenibacillus thalictri]|uniref:Pilus assembly protein n=1 Tax=Paenibacillus thalictri TaxID=2527873 RepID=A0A4Q9DTL2_9BACL|nr:TadE/TadG family type IV pilus assembly protein [Paenibacillus thalictri]TBL80248.1 pilus assembly protein [Paenibacillus thalictri]